MPATTTVYPRMKTQLRIGVYDLLPGHPVERDERFEQFLADATSAGLELQHIALATAESSPATVIIGDVAMRRRGLMGVVPICSVPDLLSICTEVRRVGLNVASNGGRRGHSVRLLVPTFSTTCVDGEGSGEVLTGRLPIRDDGVLAWFSEPGLTFRGLRALVGVKIEAEHVEISFR